MKVSSGEEVSMGLCFNSSADMPTTCFCHDVGVELSDIAL
jgi:hypothetical protein